MSRFIAFLRALNTGKNRTVTMAFLRQVFTSLGFSNVATVFGSGNVVLETGEQDPRFIEKKIENELNEALGYPIATLLRNEIELTSIAADQPFPQSAVDTADEFNIIFLAGIPDEEIRQKVQALKTATDEFIVHDREIYWLRHKKPGQSNFQTIPLEKAIPGPFTIRTRHVVTIINSKYFGNPKITPLK